MLRGVAETLKELRREVFLTRAPVPLMHKERCKGCSLATGMTDPSTASQEITKTNKTAAPQKAELKEAWKQLFATRFTRDVAIQLAANGAKSSCLLEVSVR